MGNECWYPCVHLYTRCHISPHCQQVHVSATRAPEWQYEGEVGVVHLHILSKAFLSTTQALPRHPIRILPFIGLRDKTPFSKRSLASTLSIRRHFSRSPLVGIVADFWNFSHGRRYCMRLYRLGRPEPSQAEQRARPQCQLRRGPRHHAQVCQQVRLQRQHLVSALRSDYCLFFRARFVDVWLLNSWWGLVERGNSRFLSILKRAWVLERVMSEFGLAILAITVKSTGDVAIPCNVGDANFRVWDMLFAPCFGGAFLCRRQLSA